MQLASHWSQASILVGDLLAYLQTPLPPPADALKKIEFLENKVKRLKDDLANERKIKDQNFNKIKRLTKENKHLDEQLVATLNKHPEELDQVREEAYHQFPNTEEGKTFIDATWESKKINYLKSMEFKTLLAIKAADYYYHGFRTCVKQFSIEGYPPSGMNSTFLNEDAGLEDAPDIDDEIGDQSDDALPLIGVAPDGLTSFESIPTELISGNVGLNPSAAETIPSIAELNPPAVGMNPSTIENSQSKQVLIDGSFEKNEVVIVPTTTKEDFVPAGTTGHDGISLEEE